MADDRKTNQGGSKQSGDKQATGRESEHGTGGRQGNKSGGQGSSPKGGKQSNR